MRGANGSGGGGRAPVAWGGVGVVAAGGSTCLRYGSTQPLLAAVPPATAISTRVLFPFAGTLRNLYGQITAALGAGITVGCTLYLNGVAQAMTFQFSGAAQVTGNDLVNTVVVAAGDYAELVLTRVAGVPPSVTFIFEAEVELS